MKTEQEPYPARRRYVWAREDSVITYQSARLRFVRLLNTAKHDGHTARYNTFKMVLEAIATLHHEHNVMAFPGNRLHKLLCKAAADCGWYATHGNRAKPTQNPVTGMLKCPRCGEEKPESSFHVAATTKQCEKYGWSNTKSRRTLQARFCADCRYKMVKNKKARAERKEAQIARLVHADAVIKNLPIEPSHAYKYWRSELHLRIKNAKQLANRTSFTPSKEFFQLKINMLEIATVRFNQCIDNNTLANNIMAGATWAVFLTKEEHQNLIDAHAKTVRQRREARIQGRDPDMY